MRGMRGRTRRVRSRDARLRGGGPAATAAQAIRAVRGVVGFERDIFRKIVDDYLQRRIARAPDLTAYARWASYVCIAG
jgi:hypothetical protein